MKALRFFYIKDRRSAAAHEACHDQHHDGSDGRGDDGASEVATKTEAQLWQQPVADVAAEDAYDEIANQAESAAHEQASNGPGTNANQGDKDQRWQVRDE